MAEIGLVASVMGIAAFGAKLSMTLLEMGETVTMAREQMNAIANDILIFSSVLKQLGCALEVNKALCSDELGGTCTAILTRCERVFKDIDAAVKARKSEIRVGTRIKWLFDKPGIRELCATLDSLNMTLMLIIQTVSLAKNMSQVSKEDPYIQAKERLAQIAKVREEEFFLRTLVVASYIAIKALRATEGTPASASSQAASSDPSSPPSPFDRRPVPQPRFSRSATIVPSPQEPLPTSAYLLRLVPYSSIHNSGTNPQNPYDRATSRGEAAETVKSLLDSWTTIEVETTLSLLEDTNKHKPELSDSGDPGASRRDRADTGPKHVRNAEGAQEPLRAHSASTPNNMPEGLLRQANAQSTQYADMPPQYPPSPSVYPGYGVSPYPMTFGYSGPPIPMGGPPPPLPPTVGVFKAWIAGREPEYGHGSIYPVPNNYLSSLERGGGAVLWMQGSETELIYYTGPRAFFQVELLPPVMKSDGDVGLRFTGINGEFVEQEVLQLFKYPYELGESGLYTIRQTLSYEEVREIAMLSCRVVQRRLQVRSQHLMASRVTKSPTISNSATIIRSTELAVDTGDAPPLTAPPPHSSLGHPVSSGIPLHSHEMGSPPSTSSQRRSDISPHTTPPPPPSLLNRPVSSSSAPFHSDEMGSSPSTTSRRHNGGSKVRTDPLISTSNQPTSGKGRNPADIDRLGTLKRGTVRGGKESTSTPHGGWQPSSEGSEDEKPRRPKPRQKHTYSNTTISPINAHLLNSPSRAGYPDQHSDDPPPLPEDSEPKPHTTIPTNGLTLRRRRHSTNAPSLSSVRSSTSSRRRRKSSADERESDRRSPGFGLGGLSEYFTGRSGMD
ncbi:hypothetical protein FGG08_003091 [Glutinoglossum americanum]|uniref:Fungal N-terminal domain-containing protein n=1 Tax=Glutinoglossum americanum TaxID=1670608 RepID=A0A9P8L3Y2_9PEZI|nr:hypothetical protein FGG08_003091 [Glutinoglossum americanum]